MSEKLKFFNDNLVYQDRTIVNIFTDSTTEPVKFHQATHSRFIISIDSELTSNNLSAKNTFGCCTNKEFSIAGNWIVLETPGFNFPEDRITTVTPGNFGNLSYIDGCSNSNLVDPPRNGDPCLNYLYFPPGIEQTFHTHPSVRIGTILSGRGWADLDDEKIELKQGVKFVLERHVKHRFITTDSHMSIMIFHPDSEDGPRDEHNPMKTRTYLK
jgi:quercetin dioxygenase-like cupin family protein